VKASPPEIVTAVVADAADPPIEIVPMFPLGAWTVKVIERMDAAAIRLVPDDGQVFEPLDTFPAGRANARARSSEAKRMRRMYIVSS